jgi:hypothetical protein
MGVCHGRISAPIYLNPTSWKLRKRARIIQGLALRGSLVSWMHGCQSICLSGQAGATWLDCCRAVHLTSFGAWCIGNQTRHVVCVVGVPECCRQLWGGAFLAGLALTSI